MPSSPVAERSLRCHVAVTRFLLRWADSRLIHAGGSEVIRRLFFDKNRTLELFLYRAVQ